jgi:hypothetical protein
METAKATTGDTDMNRTVAQIENDMDIARMRMDQARDKLCEAIMAGNGLEESRLEMVHAAAISDFKELKHERDGMVSSA